METNSTTVLELANGIIGDKDIAEKVALEKNQCM